MRSANRIVIIMMLAAVAVHFSSLLLTFVDFV